MPKQARLRSVVAPKLKFALSGAVATSIDYVAYILLVQSITPVVSNIISYSMAILVNFTLQKNFIFDAKRKLSSIFLLSITFSLVGLVLSSVLIYIFNQIDFYKGNQYLIKLSVTAIIFFYNFYTKRFAFENRL